MSEDTLPAVLQKLYSILIDIGYLDPEDISWPPHTDSPLPIEACAKAGFDASAIQLLQSIPRPRTPAQLFPGSVCIVYHDATKIDYLRIAPYMEEKPNQSDTSWPTMPNHQIAITRSMNRDGHCVILDAKTGMCCRLRRENPLIAS
jgi:hypothetical protein